jgi:hypothetical protein
MAVLLHYQEVSKLILGYVAVCIKLFFVFISVSR